MTRAWRRARALVCALAALTLMTGCATLVDGRGSVGPVHLAIRGFSGDPFDVQTRAALSDVIGFWRATYPKVSNGAQLPPLKGSLYSIDGDQVVRTEKAPAYAKGNACLRRRLGFIVDNAAYCQLDDSIIWDRGTGHLLPVLSERYGPALTALVFAHEFGHAIQQRMGLAKTAPATIYLESQADCAAGAFAAYALAGKAPNFHFTSADLDRALQGYLLIRDSTPSSPTDISHGDGFDRVNALQQGLTSGAAYCFGKDYYRTRSFTERGYVSDSDYLQGGNQPIGEELGKNGIGPDLNRFWAAAGQTVNKTLDPVQLKPADHPACGASTPDSVLGYCPDDNTVYYSPTFAEQAYNSITSIAVDPHTAQVAVQTHQPGDYALGELIAVAWGMAARHQFFGGSTDDKAALLAAICYSGAYTEDINRSTGDKTHNYILSPPDMDEATSAVLDLVPLDQAFGDRGTTGLERVQAFVKGYTGGLGSC